MSFVSRRMALLAAPALILSSRAFAQGSPGQPAPTAQIGRAHV